MLTPVRTVPTLAVALLSAVGPIRPAGAAPPPRILPAACEQRLALSALPEHLRTEASVYAWGEDGYSLVREGSNGFTCIVNRDDPFSIKPTCFDAEGAATIVPKIVRVGAWLYAGRSVDEIRQELRSQFESGELISPRRPGLAYMLSHYNRPFNPGTGKLGWFPPHLMFYAPNLADEDIGHRHDVLGASRSLPFIGYQGPHGYMIVLAEAPGERESIPGCPAWLEE